MKQLFEKVIIKTEADLPKVNGTYYAGYKDGGSVYEYNFDTKVDGTSWVRYFGWYLQSVTEPIHISQLNFSDVEKAIRDNCNIEFSKTTGDEIVNSSLSAVMIAFDEYFKLYLNTLNVKLTDEEIKEKTKNMKLVSLEDLNPTMEDIDTTFRSGFISGAKWVRDKNLKEDIEEELIKYDKYLANN